MDGDMLHKWLSKITQKAKSRDRLPNGADNNY